MKLFGRARSLSLVTAALVVLGATQGLGAVSPPTSTTQSFTIDQLTSVVDSLRTSFDSDHTIAAWHVENGRAYVGITNLSNTNLSHQLSALLGSTVVVYQHDPVVSAVAYRQGHPVMPMDRQKDGSPFYGGDRIDYYLGNNTYAICTAGGHAGSGSTNYEWTAGHCGPNGRAWTAGSGGPSIGTDVSTQWGNGRIDGELLTGASYSNLYWTSAGTTTTTVSAIVPDSLYPAVSAVNMCADGATTGWLCDAFSDAAYDECANETDNGTTYNVCHLREAYSNDGRVVIQGGDSGGPLLHPVSGGYQWAGLEVASSNGGKTILFSDAQYLNSIFGVGLN